MVKPQSKRRFIRCLSRVVGFFTNKCSKSSKQKSPAKEDSNLSERNISEGPKRSTTGGNHVGEGEGKGTIYLIDQDETEKVEVSEKIDETLNEGDVTEITESPPSQPEIPKNVTEISDVLVKDNPVCSDALKSEGNDNEVIENTVVVDKNTEIGRPDGVEADIGYYNHVRNVIKIYETISVGEGLVSPSRIDIPSIFANGDRSSNSELQVKIPTDSGQKSEKECECEAVGLKNTTVLSNTDIEENGSSEKKAGEKLNGFDKTVTKDSAKSPEKSRVASTSECDDTSTVVSGGDSPTMNRIAGIGDHSYKTIPPQFINTSYVVYSSIEESNRDDSPRQDDEQEFESPRIPNHVDIHEMEGSNYHRQMVNSTHSPHVRPIPLEQAHSESVAVSQVTQCLLDLNNAEKAAENKRLAVLKCAIKEDQHKTGSHTADSEKDRGGNESRKSKILAAVESLLPETQTLVRDQNGFVEEETGKLVREDSFVTCCSSTNDLCDIADLSSNEIQPINESLVLNRQDDFIRTSSPDNCGSVPKSVVLESEWSKDPQSGLSPAIKGQTETKAPLELPSETRTIEELQSQTIDVASDSNAQGKYMTDNTPPSGYFDGISEPNIPSFRRSRKISSESLYDERYDVEEIDEGDMSDSDSSEKSDASQKLSSDSGEELRSIMDAEGNKVLIEKLKQLEVTLGEECESQDQHPAEIETVTQVSKQEAEGSILDESAFNSKQQPQEHIQNCETELRKQNKQSEPAYSGPLDRISVVEKHISGGQNKDIGEVEETSDRKADLEIPDMLKGRGKSECEEPHAVDEFPADPDYFMIDGKKIAKEEIQVHCLVIEERKNNLILNVCETNEKRALESITFHCGEEELAENASGRSKEKYFTVLEERRQHEINLNVTEEYLEAGKEVLTVHISEESADSQANDDTEHEDHKENAIKVPEGADNQEIASSGSNESEAADVFDENYDSELRCLKKDNSKGYYSMEFAPELDKEIDDVISFSSNELNENFGRQANETEIIEPNLEPREESNDLVIEESMSSFQLGSDSGSESQDVHINEVWEAPIVESKDEKGDFKNSSNLADGKTSEVYMSEEIEFDEYINSISRAERMTCECIARNIAQNEQGMSNICFPEQFKSCECPGNSFQYSNQTNIGTENNQNIGLIRNEEIQNAIYNQKPVGMNNAQEEMVAQLNQQSYDEHSLIPEQIYPPPEANEMKDFPPPTDPDLQNFGYTYIPQHQGNYMQMDDPAQQIIDWNQYAPNEIPQNFSPNYQIMPNYDGMEQQQMAYRDGVYESYSMPYTNPALSAPYAEMEYQVPNGVNENGSDKKEFMVGTPYCYCFEWESFSNNNDFPSGLEQPMPQPGFDTGPTYSNIPACSDYGNVFSVLSPNQNQQNFWGEPGRSYPIQSQNGPENSSFDGYKTVAKDVMENLIQATVNSISEESEQTSLYQITEVDSNAQGSENSNSEMEKTSCDIVEIDEDVNNENYDISKISQFTNLDGNIISESIEIESVAPTTAGSDIPANVDSEVRIKEPSANIENSTTLKETVVCEGAFAEDIQSKISTNIIPNKDFNVYTALVTHDNFEAGYSSDTEKNNEFAMDEYESNESFDIPLPQSSGWINAAMHDKSNENILGENHRFVCNSKLGEEAYANDELEGNEMNSVNDLSCMSVLNIASGSNNAMSVGDLTISNDISANSIVQLITEAATDKEMSSQSVINNIQTQSSTTPRKRNRKKNKAIPPQCPTNPMEENKNIEAEGHKPDSLETEFPIVEPEKSCTIVNENALDEDQPTKTKRKRKRKKANEKSCESIEADSTIEISQKVEEEDFAVPKVEENRKIEEEGFAVPEVSISQEPSTSQLTVPANEQTSQRKKRNRGRRR